MIAGGLDEGDRVVTTGAGALREGDKLVIAGAGREGGRGRREAGAARWRGGAALWRGAGGAPARRQERGPGNGPATRRPDRRRPTGRRSEDVAAAAGADAAPRGTAGL